MSNTDMPIIERQVLVKYLAEVMFHRSLKLGGQNDSREPLFSIPLKFTLAVIENKEHNRCVAACAIFSEPVLVVESYYSVWAFNRIPEEIVGVSFCVGNPDLFPEKPTRLA